MTPKEKTSEACVYSPAATPPTRHSRPAQACREAVAALACREVVRVEVAKGADPRRHGRAVLLPRQAHVRHAGAQPRVEQHVAALDVAVQHRREPRPGAVQEAQSRRHVPRDAQTCRAVERVRAGGEGLVQAAAGHEGVHLVKTESNAGQHRSNSEPTVTVFKR